MRRRRFGRGRRRFARPRRFTRGRRRRTALRQRIGFRM